METGQATAESGRDVPSLGGARLRALCPVSEAHAGHALAQASLFNEVLFQPLNLAVQQKAGSLISPAMALARMAGSWCSTAFLKVR